MQVQWPWSFPKHELFMSKNARQGRFLHLLLQVMAWSKGLWPGWAVCEAQKHWIAERPRQTYQQDYCLYFTSTTTAKQAFLQSQWHYCHGRHSWPGKICCPVLLLTTWEKIWFNWRQQDENSKVSFCLKAKADGTKLKVYIFFPGAKRETKEFKCIWHKIFY